MDSDEQSLATIISFGFLAMGFILIIIGGMIRGRRDDDDDD